METVANLKRTHQKPYKVGKLYFGRSAPTRGAKWVVSSSADLSNPVAEFDIGKLARAYCEEARDAARASKASAEVNIPAGENLTDIMSDDTIEFEGEIEI